MRRWVVLAGVLHLCSMASSAVAVGEDLPRAVDTDRPRPRVVQLPTGVLVARTPPQGWSHLVVKSLPRLASGDADTLPGSAARTATLFRTVILADVGPSRDDPSPRVLRRIGVGLCVPDRKGRDVVVTPGREREADVELALTDRLVLHAAETQLRRGKLVAASPTFALYRAPAVMAVGAEHRDVAVCYVFLVDPVRGGLDVLVWALDNRGNDSPLAKRGVEITPGLVYDCAIDVKARRLLGALPVSWSFAMTDLPPGRLLATDDSARLIAASERRPLDAKALEEVARQAASRRLDVSRPPSNAPSVARASADGSGPGRPERTSTSGSGRRGTKARAR